MEDDVSFGTQGNGCSNEDSASEALNQDEKSSLGFIASSHLGDVRVLVHYH